MKAIKGFVAPIVLLVVWEIAATVSAMNSDTLSKPSDILIALAHGLADGSLLAATGRTLAAGGAGLLLGAALGAITGLLFGLIPRVWLLMRITVEILRPIPAIAVTPIALLFFGFGYALEIAIVAFAVFFPMTILTEAAIRQIAPRLMEVSKVLRLSAAQRVAKIVLPAALPRIFVALRLASGIALVVAVTVEIAANPMGLGYQLMLAAQSLRPADMFATLVWVGLIGWALNLALLRAEFKLFTPTTRKRDLS